MPPRLSSLGRLIPRLPFNAAASFISLGLSCALLYPGLQALGRKRDAVVATGIVPIVIGTGLSAMALLLVLAFPRPRDEGESSLLAAGRHRRLQGTRRPGDTTSANAPDRRRSH